MPEIEKRAGSDHRLYYFHKERNRAYGQVIGGYAWPGQKPGYSVVLASSRWEDPAFNCRHSYAIQEFESLRFEEVFEWMVQAQKGWAVERFYGDLEAMAHFNLLCEWNNNREIIQQDGVRLSSCPGLEDAKFFEAQMLSVKGKLSRSGKVFHLDETCPILSGNLRALQPEALRQKFHEQPVLWALSYGMKMLEHHERLIFPGEGGRQQFAVVDYNLLDPPHRQEQWRGTRSSQVYSET